MDVVLGLRAISVFPVPGRKKLNDEVTTILAYVLRIGLKIL